MEAKKKRRPKPPPKPVTKVVQKIKLVLQLGHFFNPEEN